MFRAGNFVEVKKIVSSSITTSAVNVFEAVGDWAVIEDLIVTTDGTGLAWGTSLVFKANWVTFYSSAVSWLWANATIDLAGASVKGSKVWIPEGTKYITVESTVWACTWAWVATVYLVFKPVNSNVSINAL